jgi:small subunit ribosomal protein S27e
MHKKPSRFLTVKCSGCENEQIVYSHATTTVKCSVCNQILADITGGKAIINGTVLNALS